MAESTHFLRAVIDDAGDWQVTGSLLGFSGAFPLPGSAARAVLTESCVLMAFYRPGPSQCHCDSWWAFGARNMYVLNLF